MQQKRIAQFGDKRKMSGLGKEGIPAKLIATFSCLYSSYLIHVMIVSLAKRTEESKYTSTLLLTYIREQW